MTTALQKVQDQMTLLPAADRRELLLAAVESSGGDFAGEILHALESARRAGKLESGAV